MNFVILDLEWNSAYSKKHQKFINEIIEFGAVKADEKFNIIDSFSMLITPQVRKKLNSHVQQLTHITTEELIESHNTFTHVLSKFKKFMGDSILLTWGTSDILALMENTKYYLGDETLPFMNSYCNLQAYCEHMLGHNDKARQLGLSACAEKLGIVPENIELHRAYNDALLSFECFKLLYDKEEFLKHTEPVCDRFYRKITFKNTVIFDIKNPLIDKKELYVCCDKCGKKAVKKSKWKVKNRSFRASFYCPKCKYEFDGRVIFRLKFDGVSVDRRVIEKPIQEKVKPEKGDNTSTEKPITESQSREQPKDKTVSKNKSKKKSFFARIIRKQNPEKSEK